MSAARIAIFDGPGRPFRLEARPLPDRLSPGEVLVEVAMATICGSDLHTHAGRRQEATPTVLGHEGVGRVVGVGDGRGDWQHRRVTWTSTEGCGACRACVEWGLPQKCVRVFKYGHVPASVANGLTGTCGTHILLRPGTTLVEVPRDLSDAVAASANCSAATMVHALEQRPSSCRVALILGAGLLGLHGCALLRSLGVARVLMSDVEPSRLARVTAFQGEPIEPSTCTAQSVDMVVDTTGDPQVVGDSLRLLRPGGLCVLVGAVHPQPPLPVTAETLVRGCVTMRGVHNYGPSHLSAAMAFLSRSSLPWDSLVSPALPLDRIDDAFALAATRRWPRVALRPSS